MVQVSVHFAGDLDEIAGLLAKLAAPLSGDTDDGVDSAGEESDKPKRRRRTKAEMEAARAAEAAEAAETSATQDPPAAPATDEMPAAEAPVEDSSAIDDLFGPPADPQPVPPVEEARAALTEVVHAKGRDGALGVLGEFGAKIVSEVPEARRADFIAKCKAVLA